MGGLFPTVKSYGCVFILKTGKSYIILSNKILKLGFEQNHHSKQYKNNY